MVVSTHAFTCLWCYTRQSTEDYKSWIFRNHFQDESIQEIYVNALYWATATLVTVGYGDINSRSNCMLIKLKL